ncbi:TPA: phosphate acyltransferase [Candidatus Acetothermia bacterium]|nr:phosphate acyltransferase [Candidatus Acetothermia bacterium]
MGADRPPAEVAAGAVAAAEGLPIQLVLVGRRAALAPSLSSAIEVLDCPGFVDCAEPPVQAARRSDTSIARGIAALAAGEADAFLSPGSTGAVVTTALLRLGRLPGVLRPGLCASLPTLRGEVLVIDVGATADPKPEHFVSFAHLGATYAREVLGIPQPTIGLLNIGTELGKGDRITRAAYELLADRDGFRGNVEPHTVVTERPVDVVVSGGFVGNLFLKALEGGAEAVLAATKAALMSSAQARLGAWLARSALRAVGRKLRYEEHNAAPLLGVAGLVVVAHGRSDARALAGALRRTDQACRAGLIGKLAPRPVAAP